MAHFYGIIALCKLFILLTVTGIVLGWMNRLPLERWLIGLPEKDRKLCGVFIGLSLSFMVSQFFMILIDLTTQFSINLLK
ncbi:hypothetical protein D3H64_00745 [Atopobacter sp. AH10]|uniref:hypothetical protein n=1 Tax=Atopobacter sp. AH10 TaxID=2315861 RepID=UPI000EF24F22|nr:hypothetical protein [Atopobacter sp. AH10]RLK64090.1 hypothetical protein D3H64_00745 [Atopobacter sp. AH10]